METSNRRSLLVPSGWVQAVIIVFFFGFFVLGLLAYRTYTDQPRIPAKVVDDGGNVLLTHDDILDGQQVFLRNGLMEYGSIFGHGACLGPDYTADYLHRAALFVLDQYGGTSPDRAWEQTILDFKTNRYDASTDTLTFTAAEAKAFEELRRHYQEFFAAPTTQHGLRPQAISDPQETQHLTAFFSWSAWAACGAAAGLALLLHQQLAT